MRKLTATSLLLLILFISIAPGTVLARKKTAPAPTFSVSKTQMDSAWARALKIADIVKPWSNKDIPVVLVPTAFYQDGSRVFGHMLHRPVLLADGALVMGQVITIYLAPDEACLVETVLVHEYLHCVWLRRASTDDVFAYFNGDSEGYVRAIFPAPASMTCPESSVVGEPK